MKKVYTTPEIEFVSFKMSANIAACGVIAQGDDRLWGEQIASTLATCGDMMDFYYDSVDKCYHVPENGENLFLS